MINLLEWMSNRFLNIFFCLHNVEPVNVDFRLNVDYLLGLLIGQPPHCGPASQFRANLIVRATFTNLLAMWLNASEIV